MTDQNHLLPGARASDQTHPAGTPSVHIHPRVFALSAPTAHPATEAWQRERFTRLQERLVATASCEATASKRRSIVVLPSRSVDRWHEPPAETQSYEERLLSFLLDLHDPGVELTYVTSLPVAQRTVDYYISLLPRRVRRSARKRLRLVSLSDATARPLSEKLRERPDVLERIHRTLADREAAYLMPYNSTGSERDIAVALDIPLFSPDPDHAWLGTKRGSRALFARVGVPHPLGREVRTLRGAVEAICSLRAARPELAEVVVKLDHAVSGEGNAILDLSGLPVPGTPGEGTLIEQRLVRLVPDVDGVSSAAYLRKLAAQGGVVEERLTGREVRSPSVQLEITPSGAVTVLSTHDQILHGRSRQRFAGCRFPADCAYAPAISTLARRVAEYLAGAGVIGRFAIDFLVTRERGDRWQPFALELNLRMGGTTHPYQALARLTGGSYEAGTASFKTPDGRARHYVSTDHLEIAQMSVLGRAGLLARAARHNLRFEHNRARGVVFHMLNSVEPLAAVGVTAIADTTDSADDLYARVRAVLVHAETKRARLDRPARVPTVLRAQR